MKNKPRRTQITIETHSLTIVRMRKKSSDFVYCPNCRCDVPAFNLAEAALIFRASEESLELFFRTGEVHFVAAALLCGRSLAAYFKKEIRCVEDQAN